MKHVLLFGLMLASFLSYSQYPASGVKQRLGWQTTGDGLVYRGAIADTSTLDPSGLNNAWMLLDTVNGSLYAYRSKAWQLVSGGGGVSMPFDSVTFNINEGDASEQELKYSAEKGYLQYGGLDSVQIPLLPGIWYVRNDDSVTVSKGMVVRASGTLGASGRIKVKRMIADGSIPAMYVLGIAMHDIASGADGYVMTQGKIRQVNTTAYSEGAVLYADVDTLGGLTQTEPGNGYLKLPIAFVVHSASNGTLAVRIDAGSSLRDLHDVDTTGKVDGSVLRYDGTAGYWKASTSPGIIGSGTTNYLPKFTAGSTVGNSPLYNVANNQFIIGHTASGTGAKNTLEIRGTGNTDFDGSKVDLYVNSSGQDYHAPIISLRRSRSATAGAFTKANDLDWLGQVIFNGADGDEYTGGALIRAIVDGTTGNNDMPASLLFATTPDGSSTQTERMRITSAGRVGIGTATPARSLHIAATDAIRIPVGTTGGAGSSENGDIRYNSTVNNFEWYQQSTGNWRQPVISASATGLNSAGNFAYFKSTGLDSSNVLTQSNGRIGIGTASPAAGFVVDVTGGDMVINGMRLGKGPLNITTNVAFGANTLSNVDSNAITNNIAIGATALNQMNFESGKNIPEGNTAIGSSALAALTFGQRNTAIGVAAMASCKASQYNIAIGPQALFSDTTSISNTVIGLNAMYYSKNGSYNLALGVDALRNLQNGTTANTNYNVGIGFQAGFNISSGAQLTTANQSIYIGSLTRALSNAVTNEIAIGYNTTGNGSNTTTIGNSSTTKTFFQYGETYIGTATDNGAFALQVGGTGYFSTGLMVDYTAAFDANTIFQMPNTSTKAAKGYAWNTYSDARIKSNFDTIQNALQAVQALKPVYYDQHDSEVIDGKIKLQDGKTRTVGFIAQDVAPVIPAAVQAGNDTQLWGMDYTKLIPYLTKAIQEQQAQIEALKKEIEQLKNK